MGRPWHEGADREPSEIGQKTDVKESYFIPAPPSDSHMKTKHKKTKYREICLYFCGLLQTHGHFKVKKNVKNFLDHRNTTTKSKTRKTSQSTIKKTQKTALKVRVNILETGQVKIKNKI